MRRVGVWPLMSIGLLVVVLAVGLFVLIGRPLALPDWAATRAEAVLAEQFPQLDVSLGQISVVVEDNWHPRIRAQGVSLREIESSSAILLEQIDVTLSMASLLKRQVALQQVRVSGVYVSLRRQNDGSFNVTLGEGAQSANPIDAKATLPNFGAELKAVLDRPLLAQLEGVELEALHLRYEDVRAGRGWTIDGGQARLQRSGDDVAISANLVALGARSYVSSIEMTVQTSLATNISHFGMAFEDMPAGDIASQSPALAWLDILQAPISGSLRASTDGAGVLGSTSVALQIGAGALQPNDRVKPIPFQSAHTYLSYNPTNQTLTLDEFSVQAGLISARASGKALLRNLDAGVPQEMAVQLEFTQFEVNPNDLADSPIALDNAFADFRLRLDPFELTLGQLVLSQQGQRLRLSGRLAPNEATWDYTVDGTMTALSRDAVLGVWPERFKPNLRKWISENVHNIDIGGINLALRSKGAEPPDIYADFRFSDLTLRFMKNMPVLRKGRGIATFEKNQFLVGAEGGYVTADKGGDIDITGTGFAVTDTLVKVSPATVSLVARGPVTAALSLLNRKPLYVMDKARLPVDLARGTVQARGQIDLTLKKKIETKDVIYNVDLVLNDVETTHFIKDKVISGDLAGFATNQKVMIEGDATVGKLPVHARWSTTLGPAHDGSSVLTGTAELSQLAVDEFDVGFPDNTFSGKAAADFRMDIVRGKPPVMTFGSDLVGLGVTFPPLGYVKDPDVKGKALIDMTISDPPSVDAFAYEAQGLTAKGSVSLRNKGGLDRVRLNEFQVGNWLSGAGEIQGRGDGLAPAIVLSDGRFDVRGLPAVSASTGSSQQNDIGPITANLSRVQISETYYLSNFSGQFQDNNGFGGEFSGLFNGQAAIAGKMMPKDGKQAFKITSDRGGDVISAIGVAKASGPGELVLHLLPAPETGVYDGILAIHNVKIQDAPAFAELLNAVSVVGLLSQLNGPGILLTEIAGKFRLAPERLIISQGSAVGPAMGISLDGVMELATGYMDFQGAFSPIYFINSVGRVISKKGEGLIAFNYHLKGPSDDFKVSVNPLSALTPGFFRGIFRAPEPEGAMVPKPRPAENETDDTQGANQR